jgi:hypothetical protein
MTTPPLGGVCRLGGTTAAPITFSDAVLNVFVDFAFQPGVCSAAYLDRRRKLPSPDEAMAMLSGIFDSAFAEALIVENGLHVTAFLLNAVTHLLGSQQQE